MPRSVDWPDARPAIRSARLVMLFDPGTDTTASIGRTTGAIRIASDNDLAVLHQKLAIDGDLATLTQIANHVPVHGGFVRAARRRITGADRHVDGAADLLVEEDVL